MKVIKSSRSSKIFSALNTLLMICLLLVTLLPFLYVLIESFESPADFARYGAIFPKHFSIDTYIYLLGPGSKILGGFEVSVFIAVVGTALSLLVTMGLAYALSKKYLPGRNFFTTMILITMFFSGGIVPLYFVVNSLGLLNTVWSVILPTAVNAFYFFIMRNFFQNFPDSLEESARIDGANDIRILFSIILPLSGPIVATLGLFYAVDHWNDYVNPLIYITDSNLWPLQLVINNIINSVNGVTSQSQAALLFKVMPNASTIRMASIVLSVVPIMCVYPFIQKYFVKGIMIGSIKG
jgi:putative aldouronate transport system permease protein